MTQLTPGVTEARGLGLVWGELQKEYSWQVCCLSSKRPAGKEGPWLVSGNLTGKHFSILI